MVETRPSGASRWTKCFAAPLFASRAGPQEPSDPAMEGTCAAWLAELVLTGQLPDCASGIGMTHPENHWEVDSEMAGHIQEYVNMITREGGFISAERFVRLSPLIAGTLDNSASMVDGVLRVRDLKYGFKLIEPDAEQLVIYGGALAAEMIQAGQTVTRVVTEIYQPRGFSTDGIHRRMEWTVEDLFSRCEWIMRCAEECHKPNPIATPGPHCDNCEGAPGCQALAETSAMLINTIKSDRHRHMTAQEIAERLKFMREAKKIIDAAASAVETEALARHKSGDPIPGWHLKERMGHRKFTKSREEIHILTGIDPVKEVDMTPADLANRKISDKTMDFIARRPTIGHKLMPIDPREIAKQFKR